MTALLLAAGLVSVNLTNQCGNGCGASSPRGRWGSSVNITTATFNPPLIHDNRAGTARWHSRVPEKQSCRH